MKKLCTKGEFVVYVDALVEVMFDAGEEAAEAAGKPVDALSALRSAMVEEGVMTAEELEASPCFQCVSRASFLIGADGTVYEPEEEETE